MLARLRGPLPADAPRARRLPGWLTPILIGAIAVMTLVLSGRHFVRGDWTRRSLYDLSPRTVAVLRALPRPVEATIFLYADRDSARAHAVAERTRAITGFLRELTQRVTRYAGGKFSAVEIDPDRDRQRAEGAMRRYGIGPYEMQQGVVVFTSGTRSQVVTWEDLVEPELDLDGEPSPALHAWRGEAAFLSAILTVTSDDPLRDLLLGGPWRARHRIDGRRRLRDVRGRAAPRRRPGARARTGGRRRRDRLPRAGGGRAGAGAVARPSSARCDRSSTAAAACW